MFGPKLRPLLLLLPGALACGQPRDFSQDLKACGLSYDRAYPEAPCDRLITAYPQSRTALLDGLRSPDEPTAYAAAATLGKVGDRKNLETLFRVARGHAEVIVRLGAVSAIARLGGDGLALLQRLASDDCGAVSKFAFRKLIEVDPKLAIEAGVTFADRLGSGLVTVGTNRGHLSATVQDPKSVGTSEALAVAMKLQKFVK